MSTISPQTPLSSGQYALMQDLDYESSVKRFYQYSTTTQEGRDHFTPDDETLEAMINGGCFVGAIATTVAGGALIGPAAIIPGYVAGVYAGVTAGAVSAYVASFSWGLITSPWLLKSVHFKKWCQLRKELIQNDGVKRFFIDDSILRFFTCPLMPSDTSNDKEAPIPYIPVRAGDDRTYDLFRLQAWRKNNPGQPYPDSAINPPKDPSKPYEFQFDYPYINSIIERINEIFTHILDICFSCSKYGVYNSEQSYLLSGIREIVFDYLQDDAVFKLAYTCQKFMKDRIEIRRLTYKEDTHLLTESLHKKTDEIVTAEVNKKDAAQSVKRIVALQNEYSKHVFSAPSSITSVIQGYLGISEDRFERCLLIHRVTRINVEDVNRIVREYVGEDRDLRISLIETQLRIRMECHQQKLCDEMLEQMRQRDFYHDAEHDRRLEYQAIVLRHVQLIARSQTRLRVCIIDNTVVRWFKELFGKRPNFKFIEEHDPKLNLQFWPHHP